MRKVPKLSIGMVLQGTSKPLEGPDLGKAGARGFVWRAGIANPGGAGGSMALGHLEVPFTLLCAEKITIRTERGYK